MTKKMDLTGKRFGDWTVLYEVQSPCNSRKWMCRCVCGNERAVYQTNLIRGLSTGCRCRTSKETAVRMTIHGKTGTRLYVVWCDMRRRCYDEESSSYSNYGGRGITVCDEWLGDGGFMRFHSWAYSHGYDENAPKGECTLERIDNNGNYSPDNCCWTSLKRQAQNKRNTHIVTFGKQQSLSDFCEEYGVSRTLASERLQRGWSPAEVMFFEPKDMSNHIEYNGEVHSQREWAKIFGVSKSSFQYRLSHGWTFEQAAGLESPPPHNR